MLGERIALNKCVKLNSANELAEKRYLRAIYVPFGEPYCVWFPKCRAVKQSVLTEGPHIGK